MSLRINIEVIDHVLLERIPSYNTAIIEERKYKENHRNFSKDIDITATLLQYFVLQQN